MQRFIPRRKQEGQTDRSKFARRSADQRQPCLLERDLGDSGQRFEAGGKLGVEGKVFAGIFAILPEKISGEAARRRYADFSLFPAALRDLALVLDRATPAQDVQKALAKTARAVAGNAFAVESVSVFDRYEGKGLPEGKKSLAFSLVFRAADRTLTDDEVNAAFTKIQDEIVKTSGWQVRK